MILFRLLLMNLGHALECNSDVEQWIRYTVKLSTASVYPVPSAFGELPTYFLCQFVTNLYACQSLWALRVRWDTQKIVTKLVSDQTQTPFIGVHRRTRNPQYLLGSTWIRRGSKTSQLLRNWEDLNLLRFFPLGDTQEFLA